MKLYCEHHGKFNVVYQTLWLLIIASLLTNRAWDASLHVLGLGHGLKTRLPVYHRQIMLKMYLLFSHNAQCFYYSPNYASIIRPTLLTGEVKYCRSRDLWGTGYHWSARWSSLVHYLNVDLCPPLIHQTSFTWQVFSGLLRFSRSSAHVLCKPKNNNNNNNKNTG